MTFLRCAALLLLASSAAQAQTVLYSQNFEGSLNTRVALAEAQLKKAKMKPWRSFEEAGMA